MNRLPVLVCHVLQPNLFVEWDLGARAKNVGRAKNCKDLIVKTDLSFFLSQQYSYK